MIVGVGVDLCSIQRFAEMAARRPGLAERLLTEGERAGSIESQAGRFAAKEALAKALATPGGLGWSDAEVVSSPDGAPSFVLRGTVAARAAELGVTRVHLSITHDGGCAVAFVVCEAAE